MFAASLAECLAGGGATLKATPVGPVAGGIMGCFLLLALGVYCYRHHVHRAAHAYQAAALPGDQGARHHHCYHHDQDPAPDDVAAGPSLLVHCLLYTLLIPFGRVGGNNSSVQ